MWYFTWILGLTAALAVGVINVMWYEACESAGECNDEETNVKERQDSKPVS